MRIAVVLVLALAACGGDDADSSCDPDGHAQASAGSGSGQVGGAPFGDFQRAAVLLTPPTLGGAQLAIVLDESTGSCGQPGTSGRRLVFALCDTPAAGDFEVVAPGALVCPTDAPRVSALIEDSDGTDLLAPTGTMTITYAGGCVAGTFEIDVGGTMFDGDFDATVCD
ncbi:MAG TPA: hypothetical protein VGM90_39120 [Kofleriaceae bacterium]|jgi:hypothetical protein